MYTLIPKSNNQKKTQISCLLHYIIAFDYTCITCFVFPLMGLVFCLSINYTYKHTWMRRNFKETPGKQRSINPSHKLWEIMCSQTPLIRTLRDIEQARIYTSFHRFTEVGQIFRIINIFLIKKNFLGWNLENGLDSQWISCLNYSETQEKGLWGSKFQKISHGK